MRARTRNVAGTGLGELLLSLGVDTESLAPCVTGTVVRPVTRWRGAGALGEVLVETADDAEGRRRLVCERDGRAWAGRAGVPTPAVLGAAPDGAWLVSSFGAPPRLDEAWVTRALVIADVVAAADPPLGLRIPTSTWRASTHSRAARVLRTVAGGVPAARFRRARAAYHGLAERTPAHGDYYHRNLVDLPDGSAVVDWEFLGCAPRFTDHVRLWTVLPDADLRAHALHLVLSGRTPAERRHVATVMEWLSLRLVAENLSVRPELRNRVDLAHARRVAAEAAALVPRLMGENR